MDKVSWHVKVQPFRSGESRLPTREVWNVHDQTAAWREPLRAFPEQCHRFTDVFQHMKHDNEIKTRVWRKPVDRSCDDLYPQGVAGSRGNFFVALDSEHAPTAPLKRGKHQARAATNFQYRTTCRRCETSPAGNSHAVESAKNARDDRAVVSVTLWI